LTGALVKELGQLLDADVTNQNAQGRVLENAPALSAKPAEFVRRYLLPAEGAPAEKGEFTLTTR